MVHFKEVKSKDCHGQLDSANQFPPPTQGTLGHPRPRLWELSQVSGAFFLNCQPHPVPLAFFEETLWKPLLIFNGCRHHPDANGGSWGRFLLGLFLVSNKELSELGSDGVCEEDSVSWCFFNPSLFHRQSEIATVASLQNKANTLSTKSIHFLLNLISHKMC